MALNAFLLVNVRPDSVSHPAEELRQIPGVSRVEEVSGIYDFLVEIETGVYFAQISDMLMAKPWVRRIHVLRSIHSNNISKATSDDLDLLPGENRKTIQNNQKSAQSWLNPNF